MQENVTRPDNSASWAFAIKTMSKVIYIYTYFQNNHDFSVREELNILIIFLL